MTAPRIPGQPAGGPRREIDAEVDSQHLKGEVRRYAQAGLAGIAIAFVMLVANPANPPTYLIGMGFFAVAIVLLLVRG